ncbi:MAG: DUF4276 family protein [Chitinispirillales bacterium]|jgi:hypothetical protein|nr:DUF4276 family protein [Chitinispirillales bacterium]
MIKILLCGEGVTEYGRDECSHGEYFHADGVMQVLIKKLAGDAGTNLSFVVKKSSDLKNIGTLPRKGYQNAKNAKAIKLAQMAKQEDCLHIVYHRDEDNKGFKSKYDEVLEYFTAAQEKGVPCLAIVPMHMTESWLLSDAGAFPKIPDSPKLPNKPEETWGGKGTDTHPKKYLSRVLEQFHMLPSAEICADIAEKMDVEVVRKQCPISFGQFYEDMKGFISGGSIPA